MAIDYIFSPFYWRQNITETQDLQRLYLYWMLENYKADPSRSPDWNVHTSYDCNLQLPNPINWSPAIKVYKKYIDIFLTEYFQSKDVSYEISGEPWYTAYGKNQSANTHEHLPDHFSVVHFIKFNPEVHHPISFVNSNNEAIKLFVTYNPQLRKLINFDRSNMGYYHPRFTPNILEGDIVIFPGQLEHLVEKSSSEEIRITVAMNINIL